MTKFKFMSFKKGEGRWGNISILALLAIFLFRTGKKAGEGQSLGVVGNVTATASSTLSGLTKYFAPSNTQNPIVVRKSVGLYSNRG